MRNPSDSKRNLLIGAAALAALVWWLGRSGQPPLKSQATEGPTATPAVTAAPTVAVSASQPRPVAATSPAKVLSFALPAQIQNEIRSCLSRAPNTRAVRYGNNVSLDSVIQDLTVRSSAKPPEESMANLQVRRSSGELESLHLEPFTPGEKPRLGTYRIGKNQVRVFKTDAEGLPIPTAFPEALKKSTLAELSHSFVGADPVVYRERRYHQALGNGVTAQVDEENGHAVELQITTQAIALGCSWSPDTHQPSCSCK